MRRQGLKLMLIIMVFLAVIPSLKGGAIRPIHTQSTLHAARVLNATEIYAGQSVKIYTIINNPETWTLHNITCYFLIKPATRVSIVDALNITNISTTKYVFEGEEYVNITIEIKHVGPKTIFVHWVTVKFERKGSYDIVSGRIFGVRTKGELKEEFELGINDASIEVKEVLPEYPAEGTKEGSLLAFFVMVLLPLLIMGVINKIIKKP